MNIETPVLKPSDLKICECSHLAHRHPTKKAAASQWRDKCSDCACRRFRVATNQKVGDKWVPKVAPKMNKTEEFFKRLEERARLLAEEDENRARRRERGLAEFNARLAEIPSKHIWA